MVGAQQFAPGRREHVRHALARDGQHEHPPARPRSRGATQASGLDLRPGHRIAPRVERHRRRRPPDPKHLTAGTREKVEGGPAGRSAHGSESASRSRPAAWVASTIPIAQRRRSTW